MGLRKLSNIQKHLMETFHRLIHLPWEDAAMRPVGRFIGSGIAVVSVYLLYVHLPICISGGC